MTAKERAAVEDLARDVNRIVETSGYSYHPTRRLRADDAPEILEALKTAGFTLA